MPISFLLPICYLEGIGRENERFCYIGDVLVEKMDKKMEHSAATVCDLCG